MSLDYPKWLEELYKRPLARHSINRAAFGDLGTEMDICVEPGWMVPVDRMFSELEKLPQDEQPTIEQIKEKFAELRVYACGGSEIAKLIIGRTIGECTHRCQNCGSRGRMTQVGGWYSTLCMTHTHEALARLARKRGKGTSPGNGVAWPKRRVILTLAANRQGLERLPRTRKHLDFEVGMTGIGALGFRERPRGEVLGEIIGLLDPKDADVYAIDHEYTGSVIDQHVFGGTPRPFEIMPARPALFEAAHRHGIAEDEIERLIEQCFQRSAVHFDDKIFKAAIKKLGNILMDEPEGGEPK